jgi:hypothetical protein
MGGKCVPRVVAQCNTTSLQEAQSTEKSEVSLCLPFGGHITISGDVASYTPGTPPSDGVYSKIVIADGCIVGAEKYDPPVYTSTPCAPVPNSCSSASNTSLPDPSQQSGNLFQYDASGAPLVKVTISGGSGIIVSGDGTAANPFIIDASPDSSIGIQYFRSGNDAIVLTGSGTSDDPYTYTHKNGLQQTVNGMSFDAYGHLTGYTAPSTSGTVNGVIGDDGIYVETNLTSGIATVTLADPVKPLEGDYLLGAFNIHLDEKNRIDSIRRDVTFLPGKYVLGNYEVSVNEYGTLTDIASIQTAGVVTTSASKLFTQNTGDMTREMQIVTGSDSAFRISYKSNAIPNDIQVYVDDIAYQGHFIGSSGTGVTSSYEVLTQSTFRAGEHVISIRTADTENGFTGLGYLDVTLTVVV